MISLPQHQVHYLIYMGHQELPANSNKNNSINSVAVHPFINKLTYILEAHYKDSTFHVPELCQQLCLSPMQVHRKLKKYTGLSTGKYLLHFRLQKSIKLLRCSELNISEIAWQAGFTSAHHFARAFRRAFGKPPREMRRQMWSTL